MRRLRGLPVQLLVLLVLPSFVLVLVVAFGGVALHQSAMREMVASHNLHAVEATAGALASQLDLRRQALRGLAEQLQAGEPASALTAGARSPLFDGGLAVVDQAGDVVATDGLALDLTVDFLSVLASAPEDDTVFYPLYDDRSSEVRVAAVRAAGEDRWVVGVVSLDGLGVQSVVGNLHPNNATSLALVGGDGRVLYHSEPGRTGQPVELPELTDDVFDGDTGSTTLRAGGEDVIVTYVPVAGSGWTLVQQEQWRESLALLTRYSQAAPLVLVPGLLVAAGVVWFGIWRIVWPLQRLETHATALAWGNFEAIEEPVGGIEEIDQLQATLRLLAKRVQAAQAGMRSYIGAITRGQEDERLRLARELHDQTAQSLVAIGHREQKLKRYLSADPEAEAVLADLREMTARTVDELRRIIRGMRPIYLEELGLVPALEMLVRDLQTAEDDLTLAFSQAGTPERLPPEDEIALYRIAQEALNNARQHGEAQHISLSVAFSDDAVRIAVQDDGQGFKAPRRMTDLTAEGHFGMMGMYERAALIGAQLQVDSAPGSGTTVMVRRALHGVRSSAAPAVAE